MVSCGHQHTGIILNTGRVLTFGRGEYGRLGNGEQDISSQIFVDISHVDINDNINGYDKTNAIAISCGGQHTAILLNTGRVLTLSNIHISEHAGR